MSVDDLCLGVLKTFYHDHVHHVLSIIPLDCSRLNARWVVSNQWLSIELLVEAGRRSYCIQGDIAHQKVALRTDYIIPTSSVSKTHQCKGAYFIP